VAASAIAITGWAAPSAQAAADWLPPETLDTDIPLICSIGCSSLAVPRVAMAPDGRLLAFWDPGDGNSMWSERAPGGSWSAPQTFAASVDVDDVEFDGAGNATVVFTRYSSGSQHTLEVVQRPAGQAFGEPVVLAGPGAPIGDGRIAVAANGAAVAAWRRDNRAEAAYRPAGGAFAVHGFVSAAGGTISGIPAVAIDPDGNALVAWARNASSMTRTEVAYRPAGGTFDSSPDPVSGAGSQGDVSAGFDRSGDAVVVWQDFTTDYVVTGAFRSKTLGSFGPVQVISGPGGRSPQLEVAPDGEALAFWHRNGTFELAVSPPGGASFGPGETVATGAGSQTKLAMNPAGKAMLVWARLDGSTWRLEGRPRPPGGPLGPVKEIDSGQRFGFTTSAALDHDGNGVLVYTKWRGSNSGPEDLRAAGYDAAPPRLGEVSVPAGGLAGQALSFSAAATDVWSAVSFAWSFGDGGSSSGPSAEHAYAVPANYAVGVTATDALGNGTSATRDLRISGGADGTDPDVSGLSMLRRRFAVAPAPTPLSARRRRAKRGTEFRFTLSEPAQVRIAIQRARPGRRVGARCRRPNRANRKRRKCTRYQARGALVRASAQGANRVAFSGRIGRRALKRGRYRATVTATDAAGNVSSPERVSFRIVRR
jgi:PKD domain